MFNRIATLLGLYLNPANWIFAARLRKTFIDHNGQARRRLGYLGDGAVIEETALLKSPQNIRLGSNSHINHYCCVWASPGSRITIGDDGLMGPGVKIFSSNHGTRAGVPMRLQEFVEKDIEIGDDVWLGSNVIVTAGVTIGSGTLVAAGSVVTRDLPGGVIAGGIPAKVIRDR